jgi:glucose/arabinose dehydrogenase
MPARPSPDAAVVKAMRCGARAASTPPGRTRVRLRSVAVAALAGAVLGLPAVPFREAAAGIMAVAAEAAPVLPPGWALLERPSGLTPGTDVLTDFDFLADGSVLSIGKEGTVAWSSADGATNRTIGRLPVVTDEDTGLVGLSLANDYPTSHQVYLAVAQPGAQPAGGSVRRVLRVTVTGSPEPTGLGEQQTVLELPGGYPVHSLTSVTQAADGTLWVTNGDNADWRDVDPAALRALDPGTPYGKLFHVNPDGSGVASNPFYQPADPGSWRSRVYASGLRSPFRLAIDPASGAPLVGDVGWTRWEEINLVRPGASYGWPCWEGAERTGGYRDLPGCAGVGNTPPALAYPHVGGAASVTGGLIYQGESYPEQYHGAYFFGDYALGFLSTMTLGPDGAVTRAPEPQRFATGVGGPVSLRAGPNGDVVFADLYTGTLRRLSYLGGNRPPTALASTDTDPVTRTVSFGGGGSYDLDGDQLSYRWDFGDGASAAGVTASHTYPAGQATYLARLTVTDLAGAAGTAEVTVAPSDHPPQLDLTASPGGQTFAVGEPVLASAAATDAEDGDLTAAVQWRTTLVHCGSAPGAACHDHPGSSGLPGAQFSRRFSDHGGDTHLVVTATVRDSAGVAASRAFAARPRLRTLTLAANTPAAMTVAGSETNVARVTAGAAVTASAAPTATDGVATFEGWSDGVETAARPAFTMPDVDVTLHATYLTPIERRYAADAGLQATLGPPAGGSGAAEPGPAGSGPAGSGAVAAVEQGGPALRWRDYASGRLYWTPAGGVTEVHGAIARLYLDAGAHDAFGPPASDETAVGDGVGRFSDFAAGASIYWTPGTWAHLVHGAIRAEWDRLGRTAGLGYPTTDEAATGDSAGRFNDFTGGSVYWHPYWGAHEVHGAIRSTWTALGRERGALGYPTTAEGAMPDGTGRYSFFAGGAVYWSPLTGAHELRGAIRAKWAELGWETGPMGYPVTSELGTADGAGRYNHFQRNASIYWTPATGAHEVRNAIRARWAQLGWERSYLGYPTSDEFAVPGGARSNFQHGYVIWYATGRVVDLRSP